jgi:hypothetical protein
MGEDQLLLALAPGGGVVVAGIIAGARAQLARARRRIWRRR